MCDELLFSFAFNFNMRRYMKGALRATPGGYSLEQEQTWVGLCRLNPS
jgi:hypothetical protein